MRIFLIFLFILSTLFTSAQRSNFVYIQSEPARLFSVVLNGDTLRSSKSGYLILSKLTDTAYQIAVDFPGQTWPTQYFTLNVLYSDRGYLLKDYGDKGWGLLDWRSLLVQYGKKNHATASALPSTAAAQDEFSNLLAMAAGDPSLRARVENKQADSIAIQPLKKVELPDTIVPVQTILAIKDTATSWQDSPLITNPRCSVIASSQQLDRLVQSLDSTTADLKRVLLISKSLQNFCLSVSQVDVLAKKFTTDEGRYDFLLEAWLYVSDRSQFDRLFTVFKNPAFVVRLKEMLQ